MAWRWPWLELGSVREAAQVLKWLEPPPRASTPPDAQARTTPSLPLLTVRFRTTLPVHMSTTPLCSTPSLVYDTVFPCSVRVTMLLVFHAAVLHDLRLRLPYGRCFRVSSVGAEPLAPAFAGLEKSGLYPLSARIR